MSNCRRIPVMAASLGFSMMLTGCRRSNHATHQTSSTSPSHTEHSAVPAEEKPSGGSRSSSTYFSPVHGLWEQRPFVAKTALVTNEAGVSRLLLINREARCDSASIRDVDLAIEAFIPPGYSDGKAFPIPLRLHGAGGVSLVPASSVTISLAPHSDSKNGAFDGRLSFSYRTASDPEAPSYQATGEFHALRCRAPNSSYPDGDVPHTPSNPPSTTSPIDVPAQVSGEIQGQKFTLPSALVYSRKDGNGRVVLSLRFHPGRVACFAKRSATPYLFGADLGAGDNNDYFVGRRIPIAWKLRTRKDAFSEKTIHAQIQEGWLELRTVGTKPGSLLEGTLHVSHTGTAQAESFHLDGRFNAKVCGTRHAAW